MINSYICVPRLFLDYGSNDSPTIPHYVCCPQPWEQLNRITPYREAEVAGNSSRLTLAETGHCLENRILFSLNTDSPSFYCHGCFWHGCPRCYSEPKDNVEYWRKKIRGNSLRDRRIVRLLNAKEWHVLRLWEHSLKNDVAVANRIKRAIDG